MPHSCCVENCSDSVKSQTNLNCYILKSDKKRFRPWLHTIGRARSTVYKGKVFLLICDKIQSSIHQIFTQMYLIVSIAQSHRDRPTELIKKKFFFRWPPHFSAFELPNKNLPEPVHAISTDHHPQLISRNKSRRHINPAVNNQFSQFQNFSVRVKSPQARFTEHYKLDFSLLAPTSNYKAIKFSP